MASFFIGEFIRLELELKVVPMYEFETHKKISAF